MQVYGCLPEISADGGSVDGLFDVVTSVLLLIGPFKERKERIRRQ